MKVFLSSVFFCLVYAENTKDENPDIRLQTDGIIAKEGYPCETHAVVTEDGYILQFHRIPHAKNSPAGPRPVLFLQVGLFSSSALWVTPSKIAFFFSDAGYDVWLGNYRGSTYSKSHVYLTPKDEKYWDFSWDEIALYDLPASINYILKTTGQPKLTYIGHSMGCTALFALASSTSDFNDKIDLMVALSPVVFVANAVQSPLKKIWELTSDTDKLWDALGNSEFPTGNKLVQSLTSSFCSAASEFCENAFYTFFGSDSDLIDSEDLPVISAHAPSDASVRVMAHFGQVSQRDKFAKYDFGEEENLKRYNCAEPPVYDLTSVKIPVVLITGATDNLVNETDFRRLEKLLPNRLMTYKIPSEKFSHADFLLAKSWQTLLYDEVLGIIESYRSLWIKEDSYGK